MRGVKVKKMRKKFNEETGLNSFSAKDSFNTSLFRMFKKKNK